MFTGIIKHIGTVKENKSDETASVLVIKNKDVAASVKLGSSVSVNGVCLTMFEINDDALRFNLMPETTKKTALGALETGDSVNLETSLKVGDEIGGHFVYGHVDGVGAVSEIQEGRLLVINLAPELLKYMKPQGAVTIDGVSLTIARLSDTTITVSLVDYTVNHTTLGALIAGDRVNIEADMLAKYVYSMIENQKV